MRRHRAGDRSAAGLKALGVRLAIDDFGTGYSSLSLPASASRSTCSRSTAPSSGHRRERQASAPPRIVAAVVGWPTRGRCTSPRAWNGPGRSPPCTALGCTWAPGLPLLRPPRRGRGRAHDPRRPGVPGAAAHHALRRRAGRAHSCAPTSSATGRMEVIGEAGDGERAVALAGEPAPGRGPARRPHAEDRRPPRPAGDPARGARRARRGPLRLRRRGAPPQTALALGAGRYVEKPAGVEAIRAAVLQTRRRLTYAATRAALADQPPSKAAQVTVLHFKDCDRRRDRGNSGRGRRRPPRQRNRPAPAPALRPRRCRGGWLARQAPGS